MNSKPLLGPCDSYQLEPFSYPWAWDLSLLQEKNHWQPEEISVAPDVADYKNPALDPKHKHLFESVMAQLTTFDIERADDAAETFLTLFQPAEIRHFLKRLVYEESLHTRAYRFVIENLGMPLSIYDRWHTVPAMKARVEMALELSHPVEKIIARAKLADTGYDNLSIEEKQAILRSLIFWTIVFEGIWFVVNLMGPIQQLARLGVFTGAAQQLNYVLRDEVSHLKFGVMVIAEFTKQHPECMTAEFVRGIEADTRRAIELEEEYIAYCLKDGPILGYSVPEHVATAKFFANLRLSSIGFEPVFGDDAYHAFPWFSEASELNKEISFFEKKVQEYQSGGALAFDDDSHDSGGNTLWDNPL